MATKSDEPVDTGAETIIDESGGPKPVDPEERFIAGAFDERYEERSVLGSGGMGDVLLCSDKSIGRDVALKVVRGASVGVHPDIKQRFEREARIQAQLEHPNIVPVHDLGVRPDGAVYFTMKRIKGLTLEEILHGQRLRIPAMVEEYPTRRLLGAFSSTCQAVAYAHACGVIHRDLKPANIILGDFGEVYVLDWGLAKVERAESSIVDYEFTEERTEAGVLLGTPGYMSPEQVRGEADIDARADVYSLGLILYEILTLDRYHKGDTKEARMVSTLRSPAARPAQRRPDGRVAAELDELCARATEPEREKRVASARELNRELEAYLAGELDDSRRQALALRHVRNAESALSSALADPRSEIKTRTQAIRELIAAMALDPDNTAAHQAMVRALTEASPQLPKEALEELDQLRSEQRRRAARNAALSLGALFGLVPLLLWNGIEYWRGLVTMIGMLTASFLTALYLARQPRISNLHYIGLMVLLGAFTAACVTLFGPFFVAPALGLSFSAALLAGARLEMRYRAIVIAIAITSIMLPTVLQWAGVIPPSYEISIDGALRILPWTMSFSEGATIPTLAIMAVVTILAPSMLIGRSVAVLHRAEQRLFEQAWRLRTVFPEHVDIRAVGKPKTNGS